MRVNKSSLRSTVRSVPFAVAAALVVTGCSSAPFARVGEYQRAQQNARMAAVAQNREDTPAPPTQLTRPDERDYVASAAYWGAQVQANPSDIDANINFSRNLRMMGGAAQAVMVMKGLVMRDPGNPQILAEYGKALTAAERPQDAIGFLTQAIQLSPNDWTLLSARGVAYDQANNHTLARADYNQALAIDEGNPTVLTNLALSYFLAGQPAQAEPILRQVVSRADATPAMRQNLAMVLAVQGKAQEARALGQMDLGADDAVSNAQLFAQFEAPRAISPPAQSSAPAPAKSQVSASTDISTPAAIAQASPAVTAAPKTPDPIAGDPMATPVANAPSQPPASADMAVSGPRQLSMAPVVDDEAPAVPAPPKAKPIKKSAPVKAAASPAPVKPAMARPVTSNGETLITTINGIPVIGDAKPKGKPSASADGLLRGGSL